MVIEAASRYFDLRREHARDLGLVSVAVPGEDDFDLARLVLEDWNATLREHRQDRSPCLSHRYCAGRIATHEQLFQRGFRGRVFFEQLAQVLRDDEQSLPISPGPCDDGAAGQHQVRFRQQRKTCAREPRIDPEDQSVSGARHLSITFYTCAETRSKTLVGMSKLA